MVTIGVTSQVAHGEPPTAALRSYLEGVRRAGAQPVLLPWEPERAAELLEGVDALLITGGPDIDPALYGQGPHPTVAGKTGAPERDAFELAIARLAYQRGVPTLGICRGLQVMNVALGGTLVQDVPSQIVAAAEHQQQYPQTGTPVRRRGERTHRVEVSADSLLARVLGESAQALAVNSMHHQAVDALAPDLRVSARALEGQRGVEIVEGLEASSARHPFYLAVQWHPEELANPEVGGDEQAPDAHALFAALAHAARRRGVPRL